VNLDLLQKISDHLWRIEPRGAMRVPGLLFASEALLREMDDKVAEMNRAQAELGGRRQSMAENRSTRGGEPARPQTKTPVGRAGGSGCRAGLAGQAEPPPSCGSRST